MQTMQQKKAYKYRIYPTDEQVHLLARTFGCCRYIYNWGLRQRTDAFFKRGERLYYNRLAIMLTKLKQQEDTAWLNEVSSVPLQQTLRHLDSAFRNFFEGRAGYPTFKKKHGPQSASYASNAFTWDGANLTLAKMERPLDIHWSRPLPEGCKKPSLMWDGVSWCANSNTKLSGTDVPWSKLTSGIPPLSAVSIVGMCWTPYRLMSVSGPVPNVASSMIVISMQREMCWPQGLRCLPVERL